MQNYIGRLYYLVRKLRDKYAGDLTKQGALSKIVWYSFPVVYPNYVADVKELLRVRNNRKQKKKRVNAALREMFQAQDNVHFVTLTFRPDVMETTSAKTRHRYVLGFLSEHCRDYIGNIDYGGKNGREHYHAVVAFDGPPAINAWQYGLSSVKPVKKGNDNSVYRMSAYIVKLQNHAGKDGAGRLFRKHGMKTVDNIPF